MKFVVAASADGDLYRLNGNDGATACAKFCTEILEAVSVCLKMQFRDERKRAIDSWRIGIALFLSRCIYRSFREMKNRRSQLY